jgi:molybdopterin/thiamine biosynthesis adenylyltransferase
VTPPWRAHLDAELAGWRSALAAQGFSDDGTTLRGPVTWATAAAGTATAVVEVEPEEMFPFAAPRVRVLDPGADIEFTFHIDRPRNGEQAGSLCLWDDTHPVDQAPWLDPLALLARISAWLTETAAGWPNDSACDLERYLPPDSRLVLYDEQALAGIIDSCTRTRRDPSGTITVTAEVRRTSRSGRNRREAPRKDRRLAWVGDLGEIERPIRDWPDLVRALGDCAAEITRLVQLGRVEFLLLGYRRGQRAARLALAARPVIGNPSVRITVCESADTSLATRLLRAGPARPGLTDCSVAIVGLGAIGSHVADLLFRSGIERLTLIDPQILRPGNVIRHLADDHQVGQPKVHAVKTCLASRGLDATKITTTAGLLCSPQHAIELSQTHDVVVDATASARTTSLLTWAAAQTGRPVVSVCVQRQGRLARVDRFPPRGAEHHLDPLPEDPDGEDLTEMGCGEAVSPTPPSAVVCAAELAARVIIDEATRDCTLPTTLAVVREPIPNSRYAKIGLHSSSLKPRLP